MGPRLRSRGTHSFLTEVQLATGLQWGRDFAVAELLAPLVVHRSNARICAGGCPWCKTETCVGDCPEYLAEAVSAASMADFSDGVARTSSCVYRRPYRYRSAA